MGHPKHRFGRVCVLVGFTLISLGGRVAPEEGRDLESENDAQTLEKLFPNCFPVRTFDRVA